MKRGFTLVELLAVVAIVGVLAALLLPAAGSVRQSADNAGCLENLRQLGLGMQNYCNDHDGTLPGPIFSGIYPIPYQTCITYFVAPYLNLPVKGTGGQVYPAPQTYPMMLCPAYRRVVRSSLWTQGFSYQAVYALRLPSLAYVHDGAGLTVSPWGHDGNGTNNGPIRLVTLGTMVQPSKTWAIEDVDVASYPSPSPAGVAAQPVHRKHWNKLYFDWHVDSSPDAVSNP